MSRTHIWLLAFLLILIGVEAETSGWVFKGPWGGPVFDFAFDVQNPDVVFMIGRGLFRSDSGGARWERIETPVPFDRVVTPEDRPGTVLAIRLNGFQNPVTLEIFQSFDEGRSWQLFSTTSVQPYYFYASLKDFALDPKDSNVMYAAVNGIGLFRSDDSGKTWQRKASGLANRWVHRMAVNTKDPSVLYLTESGRLYRSTNRGEEWIALTDRAIEGAENVAISYSNPNTIYYGGGIEGRMYRTVDAGTSWDDISNSAVANLAGLTVDPQDSQIVYAITRTDALKSTDAGQHWGKLKLPSYSRPCVIELQRKRAGTVFVGTLTDVLRSIDNASSWHIVDQGMDSLEVTRIRASRRLPVVIAAQTTSDLPDVFIARGPNQRWRRKLQSRIAPSVMDIKDLQIDPMNPEDIMVGAYDGIIGRSTNGGGTWRFSHGPGTNSLALHPLSRNLLYTCGATTTDGGKTWQFPRYYGIGTCQQVIADPLNTKIAYQRNTSRLFRTVNGGKTWKWVSDIGTTIWDMEIDPSAPSTLYLATPLGVFKSINRGTTFALKNVGLPEQNIAFVTVNPFTRHMIFASTGNALWISLDGAEHWQSYDLTGVPNGIGINDLAVDRRGALYLATERGVFCSE